MILQVMRQKKRREKRRGGEPLTTVTNFKLEKSKLDLASYSAAADDLFIMT